MSLTLGEKLRAAREERGISISDVAEQTRIAPMYLECIEKDDYKPLPGGIFNKGFVKSYARYIGFDENEALQDYSRLAAQAEVLDEDKYRSYRPEVLTDDRARASMLPTILFAGIILALMTGGILFLVNYIRRQPEAPQTPANTASMAPEGTPGDQIAPPAQASNVPSMQSLKVEFRSTTEPISLSATSDGKTSVNTVTPGGSLTFEPKENLKLGYSKSLSTFAQLFINGRQITLPSAPANPKRVAIEIEINRDNLAQIWESGQIQFGTTPAANTAVSPPATATQPAAVNAANTTTRRPLSSPPGPATNSRPPAAANTARPVQTPIVVGGNRNIAAPRRTP